ncbi:unimolecular spanin [Salmonella virus STSR3]|nr:unimolecular spanin [Salmonella virus STSR3]
MKESSATAISHDEFMYALLILLYSDMRAFGDDEHQLTDRETGELLIHVRKF